jgi:hypothetical protein
MNTKQIRLATTGSTRENTNTTTTRKKHNTQNTNNKMNTTLKPNKYHATLVNVGNIIYRILSQFVFARCKLLTFALFITFLTSYLLTDRENQSMLIT